jgi:hypothetical protein
VPVRGNDPVLKVTCATTDDAGGADKGACQATGFLASDSETTSALTALDSAVTARVDTDDPSGAQADGAVVPAPIALADAAPDTQVTRGTIRRPLNRRGRATLKLRLNSTGKRLLKESGVLRVRLQVDVTDRTGRSTELQLLVTLLRKRR